MEDDGFPCCGGELHLGEEGGLLDLGVGVFDVVVVEAHLAGGEAEGVGEKAGEFFESGGGGVGGLAGVDAGGGEDAGEIGIADEGSGVGDLEAAVHGIGTVPDADGEDGGDTCDVGAAEDGVAVGVVEEIEMGVGVYEHGGGCGGCPPYLWCKVFEGLGLGPDFGEAIHVCGCCN